MLPLRLRTLSSCPRGPRRTFGWLALLLVVAAASPAAAATPAETVPTPAPGPGDEPLMLRQALERAARGNNDLRRERANVAISDAGFLAARGQFDTLLTGGATFSRSTTPPVSTGGADLVSGSTNRLDYNAGLSRNLETGGSVSLGWTGALTYSTSKLQCGGLADSCTIHTGGLALNFRHPLLRGFGAEIAQANLRKARVQKDLALLNRQMRVANVIRDVAIAYWELSYSTQELAILNSGVDLARDQLKFTRAQIEVGRAAPLDAAAAERAISDRQQSVVVSEQNLFYKTLDLLRLFAQPVSGKTPRFIAIDLPDASPHDVDIDGEIGKALANNPQLRSLRLGLKLNEIDIQTAQATLKPQLDAVGSFGSSGRKGTFADAVAETAGLDNMAWSAGLNLSVPIENRGARGNLASILGQADLAHINADDFELAIRDSVIRTSLAIRAASRRLEFARASVGFAAKNLEAEQARFVVGRSTSNDVLLRQQDLKQAQIQVVRAIVDLLDNEATLAAVTGDVLDRFGVTLKGT